MVQFFFLSAKISENNFKHLLELVQRKIMEVSISNYTFIQNFDSSFNIYKSFMSECKNKYASIS
jgi:hypothetical protein